MRRVRVAAAAAAARLHRGSDRGRRDGGDGASGAVVPEHALRLGHYGLDKVRRCELAGTRGIIFGRITTAAAAALVVRDAIYL